MTATFIKFLLWLLLIPVLMFGWLITTSDGLRWAYSQAEFYLPGVITINQLDGSLLGPISVSDLEYAQDGNRYKAAQITLDWTPVSLLSTRINITQLTIQSLHILLASSAEAAAQTAQQPLQLPDIHLPWNTHLKSVQIDGLQLQQNNQTFELEQINLSASTLFSQLSINELSVHAENFSLQLSGEIQLAKNYRHGLKLNWQTELPSAAIVSGKGKLIGDLKTTQLQQSISGAMQLKLQVELSELLQKPAWKAKADVTGFDLSQLDASLPPLSGSARLESQGNLQTQSVSGNLNGLFPQTGKFDSSFRLKRLADNSIQIEQLQLHSPLTNTQLETSGTWKPGADGGAINLALHWKNLRWPLQDQPWFSSASGNGNVEGNLQHYQFNIFTDSPIPEIIASSWQASADGNLDGLNVHALSVSAQQSQINVKGRLNWTPVLSWQAEVDASEIDPALLLAEWPGKLNSKFTTAGRLDDGRWTVSADIAELSGKLRDYPLSASSQLSWLGDRLDIQQLALQSGNTKIRLKGQAGATLNLDWSIDSSDLVQLHPQASGELQASGQLKGSRETPHILATFNAKKLQLPDYQVGSLSGNIDVDLNAWHKADFNLLARELMLQNNALESVDITALKQRIVAKVVSPQFSTEIELKGEAHSKGWQGDIRRASIETSHYSSWQLKKPARLSIDQRSIELETVCWLNPQQAELCATLKRLDDDWQSTLLLSKLPLMQFSAWLPADIKLDSVANASVELHLQDQTRLQGKAHIELPAGSIMYPLLDGELEQWAYRNGRIDILLNQKGLEASSEIAMENGDLFNAEAKLVGFNPLQFEITNTPIQAHARLRVLDLSFIEALVPEISKLKGDLAMNLSADGKLSQPRMMLEASLQNSSLQIPRLGLNIEHIRLSSQSENFEKLNFQLDAQSGKGSLQLLGQTQLNPKAGWPTELSIKGQEFEVSRIPEARVQVSPDLKILLVKRNINISGNIHIPYADLQPRDTTSAARVSNDVVFIGEEQLPEEKFAMTTRVRLTLGERINFFGFGFEGRLGGNLLLEDEPGQFTKATGEINIPEGRYRAYGQRLDIERGRLLYTASPITNPGLDIRAVRKINEVTAGIAVKGSLNAPELDLFSTPAMGQTDALSYLLMGRPLESSSGEDGAIMAKAALALGLSGGDRIARTIGDRFGLDEMRVESNDTGDQASLVIGRYLSPRLYVSYGVGLIESVNTLSVRYKISDKWQLKAESGEYQGADILYTFER
ncbi:MAG: translocation/assembly module TamB domain-containing protein [Gammaproteobacteria bacterium]|nr:translocation/assembly module TamB domain-containing protein [Gammaproteobacteria bacterium]